MERVIVIGAGLAGLSAARTLAEAGQPCWLVSAQQSERAQSVMAEGGINAALDLMGEGDSWEQHADDTLRGGCYLADPAAVRNLCEHAPDVVRDYIGLGVPFNVEHGRMVQRYFGGQKKARTAFAKSSTGKALVTALVDEVRKYEGVPFCAGADPAHGARDVLTMDSKTRPSGATNHKAVDCPEAPHAGSAPDVANLGERIKSVCPLVQRLPHHELIALHVADGACRGVTLRNAYSGELLQLAGPVILCTGGYGGLFGDHTTGAVGNDGTVHALALAAGVQLANLEFVQYHPTTAKIAGKRMLISEAARGEGGRLWVERDGEPYYFMEERFPELGNLSPRDVVSREEAKVLADPALGNQVWLDLRHLPRSVWRERLSDLRDECKHYLGIDPAKEPLPVEPGIHYTMGGIRADAQHRTSVAGLYAAGECACQYHGANRLGGNSLLGATFGGKVAAATLLKDYAEGTMQPDVILSEATPDGRSGVEGSPAARMRGQSGESNDISSPGQADLGADARMHDILNASLGVVRNGDSLRAAEAELAELASSDELSELERTRLTLARAAVACALAREESRGAHWRNDFPDTSDAFQQTTVVELDEQGNPHITFEPTCMEKGYPLNHASESAGALNDSEFPLHGLGHCP